MDHMEKIKIPISQAELLQTSDIAAFYLLHQLIKEELNFRANELYNTRSLNRLYIGLVISLTTKNLTKSKTPSKNYRSLRHKLKIRLRTHGLDHKSRKIIKSKAKNWTRDPTNLNTFIEEELKHS